LYHPSALQTNAYLDSLAQAVVAQQNEGGLMHETGFEQEEGPANEATLGAQINAEDATDNKRLVYYAVAHRISEKVTTRRQPNILVVNSKITKSMACSTPAVDGRPPQQSS
jgi:ATP-dependent helicase STH1/SNF2